MKATISYLFNTSREIICFDNSEFDRPTSFADLKKCDNVVVGEKIPGTKIREVLVDERIVLVEPNSVKHPFGGTMQVLEIQ